MIAITSRPVHIMAASGVSIGTISFLSLSTAGLTIVVSKDACWHSYSGSPRPGRAAVRRTAFAMIVLNEHDICDHLGLVSFYRNFSLSATKYLCQIYTLYLTITY